MASLFSGITVGPYEIIDRLDRGGMADVYLARRVNKESAAAAEPDAAAAEPNAAAAEPDAAAAEPGDEAPIVLRVIEYAGADPDALEAERMGAELQQRLSRVDPRVPRIHDYGELDDCCFFVEMEYVEGEDLADRLNEGPLPWRRAAEVAAELCDTLAVAHAFTTEIEGKPFSGIVHGDVKPKNIRLEKGGAVRILDFGIAKALSLTRRHTRNVFASVAYASPERLMRGSVDAQADLWAVGVILYEMLAGRPPFRAETTQKLERVIRRTPAPAAIETEVPEALRRVLHRALSPQPSDRYAGAEAFKEDLDAVLAGREPEAPRVPAGAATRRTPATETAMPQGDGAGATRRTVPAVSARTEGAHAAGTATRRTEPSPAEAPVPPPVKADASRGPAKVEAQPSRLQQWKRRVKRGVLGLVISSGLLVAALEAGVWNEASSLRNDLEEGLDPEAAWDRYAQLVRLSPLDVGVQPVRTPLREAFLARADAVITRYRNHESPDVREGDWEEARAALLHAEEMGAGRDARARRLVVEGHLARINQQGQDAVVRFTRAAELQPDWPDPYLGLVNTYLYEMQEYERAIETLGRLREMDYPLGKREIAQYADAEYFRALQLLPACDEADEARACLERVRGLFQRSIARYEEIIPWGRSQQNSREARRQLGLVEGRLADLRRREWQERLERFLGWG